MSTVYCNYSKATFYLIIDAYPLKDGDIIGQPLIYFFQLSENNSILFIQLLLHFNQIHLRQLNWKNDKNGIPENSIICKLDTCLSENLDNL